MSNEAINQFALHLQGIEDAAGRERAISRAKMLAMQGLTDESFEAPVRTLGEYLDTPIPIPPSLVWPTIAVRGEITTTLGRAGKGKTTFNLNRIMAWSAGRALWDGFKNKDGEVYLNPSEPLKTLVVENEGNAGMFHQKMGLLLTRGALDEEEQKQARENIFIYGDGGYSGLKLDDDEHLNKVRSACEKWNPDIMFIEPFRSLYKGEENSSTDMAAVIDNLIALATDYQCAVILSHHERKGGAGEDDKMSAGRGSTVLEGAVAVMENFESVKAGDFREVTWSKARYLQPPTPVRCEYDVDTGWYRHVPEGELQQAILTALADNEEEPLNNRTLAEILNETQVNIGKAVKKLHADERITRLQGVSDGAGSTGYRWRLKVSTDGDDNTEAARLGF